MKHTRAFFTVKKRALDPGPRAIYPCGHLDGKHWLECFTSASVIRDEYEGKFDLYTVPNVLHPKIDSQVLLRTSYWMKPATSVPDKLSILSAMNELNFSYTELTSANKDWINAHFRKIQRQLLNDNETFFSKHMARNPTLLQAGLYREEPIDIDRNLEDWNRGTYVELERSTNEFCFKANTLESSTDELCNLLREFAEYLIAVFSEEPEVGHLYQEIYDISPLRFLKSSIEEEALREKLRSSNES